MRKSILLILSILIVSVIGAHAQPSGFDPNVPDTVYIDSISTSSASVGYVPVYFFNDETLAGIEVTITYNSTDVFIDSFSFAGSRLEGYTTKGGDQLSSNSITIYTYVFDEQLIQPGSGLMGYLFFSFLPNITDQVVTIDTTSLILGDRTFSTVFSDETANPFAPVVVNGYLNISNSGCCLGDRGNVDNSPDDVVDVSDLLYLVDYQFAQGPAPVCMEEANCDGSLDGSVDISDLLFLVDYQFTTSPPPLPSCP